MDAEITIKIVLFPLSFQTFSLTGLHDDRRSVLCLSVSLCWLLGQVNSNPSENMDQESFYSPESSSLDCVVLEPGLFGPFAYAEFGINIFEAGCDEAVTQR